MIKKVLSQNFLMKLMMATLRVARADEGATTPPAGDPPPAQPPTPSPAGTISFEQLIAKARQEEKDKLYPEINKLKGEADGNVKKINDLLLVVGEKDSKIRELETKVKELEKQVSSKGDSEEVKTLKTQLAEKDVAITQLQRDVQVAKLDSYKQIKMAEANGALIPEMVIGNTEDEINASIEKSKQRYAEILKNAGVSAPRSTTVPPANPATNTIDLKDKYPDEIARMSPKEWAEYRKQLGIK